MESIECKRVFLQGCRIDNLSVCRCVCLSRKCTVAKRLSWSGCRLGWWVGSVDGWCIRWGRDRRRGRSSFGVNLWRSCSMLWGVATRLFQNYSEDLFYTSVHIQYFSRTVDKNSNAGCANLCVLLLIQFALVTKKNRCFIIIRLVAP